MIKEGGRTGKRHQCEKVMKGGDKGKEGEKGEEMGDSEGKQRNEGKEKRWCH